MLQRNIQSYANAVCDHLNSDLFRAAASFLLVHSTILALVLNLIIIKVKSWLILSYMIY